MITSSANPGLRHIRQLASKAKTRREEGLFLVEGPRMAEEIPGDQLEAAYCSESFAASEAGEKLARKLSAQIVADKVFSEISETITPQGILALVKCRRWKLDDLIKDGRPVAALETLQDPGNLGTIFRTGEGAGIGGILLNRTSADPYNPKTVRATMGSIFRMPHVISEDFFGDLARLKTQGYRLYAAHLEGERRYTEADFFHPSVFLIGNEGSGLTDQAVRMADEKILIPMEGEVESLNAAIAATLLVYEAARQRMNHRGQ